MKFKKLIEEIMRMLRNSNLISDLSNEIDIKSEELKDLKDEKKELKRNIETLKNENYLLKELNKKATEQMSRISGSIDQMLDLSISDNSKLELEEIYNRLEFVDSEGWCIYRASQEILNIDVFREFIVEDTMGRFEESDGHELKNYMEIVAFGECTYKIISDMYEILDTYTIDYDSKEYKDYLDKLYPLAVHKLVDKLYKEEPSVKLQFIKRQMEHSSQDTKEKIMEKILELNNKNEAEEVDDEEMEI